MVKASESNLQVVFKALTKHKSYFKSFLNNKGVPIVRNFTFRERAMIVLN